MSVSTVPAALAVAPTARAGWRMALAAWGVTVAALLAIFHKDVAHLAHLYWVSSTFGHCLLVGPILAWLVWQRREELAQIEPQPWLPGAGLVLLGTAGWMVGELAGVALLRHAALVFMLQASVPAIFGLAVARGVAFPLFYALFLIPVGEQLVPYLQIFTAHFSVWLLELVGVPAYMDGVFISIPNGDFEVAEACSGVRFLIAMIAFSVLVANVCYLRWSRRIAFVAGAIVTSIVANGFRAWGIIFVASRSTPDVARGVDHVVYGWVFFAIVMALVLAAGWRFFDRPVEDPFIDPRQLQPDTPQPAPVSRFGVAFAAVLALALAGPAYAAWTASRGDVARTIALRLDAPPGWRETVYRGLPWKPNYAGASATAFRSFVDGEGQVVDLYVAVYDRQSEKHELIGWKQGLIVPSNEEGGWGWAGSGAAPQNGAGAQLNQGPAIRDAWQWYRVNGRLTGSQSAAKIEGLKAKLFAGDPQAATVVVSAQRNDQLVSAEPALQRFLMAIGAPGTVIDRAIVPAAKP